MLLGQKVNERVARMRTLPPGIDQRSASRHPDWVGPDDLRIKIEELREATEWRVPIYVKLGATRVDYDVKLAVAAGADLITFSGDKLLGGPQAGLIVGRADLIARLNANPMKRALRLDKGRLAALEQVLLLYLDPDRLAERLPALRLLTRPADDIRAAAGRLGALLRARFPDRVVAVEACRGQIGSGALPAATLASFAVTLGGGGLEALAAELRGLARPVIGRIADGRLWLDCRCLEASEEAALALLLRL